MKKNTKVGLIGLFVVIGSLAAWDIYKSSNAEKKNNQNALIISNSIDQIDKVQIVNLDGEILLIRGIDGWKLFKPLEDIADNNAVEDFLESMKEDRIIETLDSSETIDWANYGLDKPYAVMTLTTSGGKVNSLQVSSKSNFEDNVYARKDNEDKVSLVNSIWQSRLEKKAIDFRERRVFRHSLAAVDHFQIKYKNEVYKLIRKDGNWVDSLNLKEELDQNKVREMLTEFSEAKGSEVLDKLPAKLVPMFTISVQRDGKAWEAQVSQASDFGIYVSVNDPKYLMKLEPGALDYFIEFSIKNLKKEISKEADKGKTL